MQRAVVRASPKPPSASWAARMVRIMREQNGGWVWASYSRRIRAKAATGVGRANSSANRGDDSGRISSRREDMRENDFSCHNLSSCLRVIIRPSSVSTVTVKVNYAQTKMVGQAEKLEKCSVWLVSETMR